MSPTTLLYTGDQKVKIICNSGLQCSLLFTEFVAWVSPSTISAYGGDVLVVNGFGFDSTVSYACHVNDQDIGITTTLTQIENTTILYCFLPRWNVSGGNYSVMVFKTGQQALAGNAMMVNVKPFWNGKNLSIAPTKSDSIIFVTGGGFASHQPYICTFSKDGNVVTTKTIHTPSFDGLSCLTPLWLHTGGQIDFGIASILEPYGSIEVEYKGANASYDKHFTLEEG
jgi:hypothetical protein